MNLYFGSVLATIALTVPSVLFIGALVGQEVRLGPLCRRHGAAHHHAHGL